MAGNQLAGFVSIRASEGAAEWWASLPPAVQRELKPARTPRGLFVRFVEPGEDTVDEPVPNDFYEHLVAHELLLDDGRAFRICKAHRSARRCLLERHIPRTFVCPLRSEGCPLAAISKVGAGRDAKLVSRPTAALANTKRSSMLVTGGAR